MSHNCDRHFEQTGDSAEIMSETIVLYGTCGECNRPLKEVYDYTGTMDDQTDQWVHRVVDETVCQLHDVLDAVVARGRAGEWREAVDAMRTLNDKLDTIITEGDA